MKIQYAHHPDAPAGTPPLAVRAGDFIFVGGQIAAHPTQGVPAEAKLVAGRPFHGSDIEKQIRYIYTGLARTLDELGSSIRQVMEINSYHMHGREIDMALRVRRDFFEAEAPPPSTLVRIAETTVPGATAVLDVITLINNSTRPREVFLQARPQPGSGYKPPPTRSLFGWPVFSQAARGGGFVYTVGVAAREVSEEHPETLPREDEIFDEHPVPLPRPKFPYQYNRVQIQTESILTDLKEILEAAGASLEHVVRADVHLRRIEDLAVVNKVWERFFPVDPPARTVLALPMARPDVMLIEIDLIAVDPSGPFRKEVISTRDAPTPLGPEPQAVRAGPYVYLSSQLATDYKHGLAPEARRDPNFPYHSSSIARQVEYVHKNVDAICRAAGSSSLNLVQRRSIHLDLRELPEAEEVWKEKLADRLPPTTTFRIDGPLAVPGCTVQYDLIAYDPS